ncbi:MAG TPA: flagellar biosynthetic protein FliR [Bryobacteraceae bacterium]|nr:flagellar biosynthetic protein FliR [Bryobacteraceae bacterium]
MQDKQLIGFVIGCLLVLTRVSTVFTFLPFPGFRAGPDPARVLFSIAVTVALFPVWPRPGIIPSAGTLALWEIQEAALGLTVGVALSFLAEATQIAAQLAGLQAGFSFASTIDPNTQADAGILIVLTQLLAGLIFFACGFHRDVILVFARSLETCPPGSWLISPMAAEHVWRLGAGMFSLGVRLAMPVIALLLLVDVTFALMGKINSHLQMLSLAFPAKMLAGMAVFAVALAGLPFLFRALAEQTLAMLLRLMER